LEGLNAAAAAYVDGLWPALRLVGAGCWLQLLLLLA
jgi:hypothetical protein